MNEMSEEKLFTTYEKELKEFEDWILENPRLPKNINKLLLLRFLRVYDFDVNEAKKLLVIFFETRKRHPHIFHNRDIDSDEFQNAMSLFQIVGMRKTTGENHKVTVFRLTTSDATNFSYIGLVRLIVAMLDTRFIYCDDEDLINGEIGIVDTSNFTFRHFTKIITHIGTAKAYTLYSQEAAPIKIIQNHFINCSPIMGKMMSFFKPFIKAEVWDSMKFHASLDDLKEYLDEEVIPVEFGGKGDSIDELNEKVLDFFKKNRDYLLNDDNWKIEDELDK